MLAQHKSTAEKFDAMDTLTASLAKTKDTLAQVQDFVNMHLKQQVPKQFENVRNQFDKSCKSLGQRIDNTE